MLRADPARRRTPVPDLLETLRDALAQRYAVERELGRGGMATVFLAEDVKHHRQVALKVLHPDIAEAIGVQDLERHLAVVLDVLGQEDGRHAAAAELALDGI